jgi:hypothetical protein
MFRRYSLLLVIALTALLYACSDDNSTDPQAIDIKGYWKGDRTVGNTEYTLELNITQNGTKLTGHGDATVVTQTAHERREAEYGGTIEGTIADTLIDLTIHHIDDVPVVKFEGGVIPPNPTRMEGYLKIDTIDYQIELLRQ